MQYLSNTKSPYTRGFTIVELMIVVIVVGILASVTVVSYQRVQEKSNTAAAKVLAENVARKAEMYKAAHSVYPSYSELRNNRLPGTWTPDNTAIPEAKLENINMIISSNPSRSNGKASVRYSSCGTAPNYTGATISYLDYETGAPTSPTSPGNKSIVLGIC